MSLMTDLYQMTMSYAYWKAGFANKEAVFHLFFRRLPFHGGFAVAAGLETIIKYLENFCFDESDIDYLSTLKTGNGRPLFCDGFFNDLLKMKFTCDLDAVPEGTTIFPFEPVLRVKGPLIQCQILETPLLNLFNFPTLIATKAARICMAAEKDRVIEFGLRRAQGVDGALTASRAAYIGGCHATSNLLAGKVYGIPVSGTHSHSWVMVFDDEEESFKTYAENLPDHCVFLVDTYNTLKGIHKAIRVGKWLREHGHEMLGIRLDSGDLAELSIQGRKLLDEAGFSEVKIVASNELNEWMIRELKSKGARIDTWGVGTHLVTGGEDSALDGVYKLSAIRNLGEAWKYKLKLSEQMQKVSNPGILQVRRYRKEGENISDVIYDVTSEMRDPVSVVSLLDPTHEEVLPSHAEFQDLLVPIFRGGKCVYSLPSLDEIRQKTTEELSHFNVGVKQFFNPHSYFVGMEKSLDALKMQLVKNIKSQTSHDYIFPHSLNE